uniref:Tyrosinase copper-binding domain-containing protein n=1 Tax=Chlamydomonas euryale TaxID=1486919 RepID=A0A7R9V365_9CHLO|mmetsp:Transcript_154/g.392  ORF Transcript_154/g.392 Transcript_154/m.392 type:complete len:495 (+) Transcript_154:193-1677(+)
MPVNMSEHVPMLTDTELRHSDGSYPDYSSLAAKEHAMTTLGLDLAATGTGRFSARNCLILLCLALVFTSTAVYKCGPYQQHRQLRVRKELRSLTDREMQLFVTGLATMLSVDTGAGQLLFGPKYKEYDYFIIKHTVATQTPVDGVCCSDVAHFGPWFLTWHEAFIMEFENALLSVVPELGALPYWEMYEDFEGTTERPGKFYGTADWAFTPRFFGSMDGDPRANFTLTNSDYGGVFGGRAVSRFNAMKYADVAHLFNGSKSGLLRDPHSERNEPYVIRYPTKDLIIHPSRSYMKDAPRINFTVQDLERCTDFELVKSMWDFMLCIDLASTNVSGLPTNVTDYWMSHVSRFSHAMFHNVLGSLKQGTQDETHPLGWMGDARVVNTSPNEVLGFFPFHANLIRVWQIWKKRAELADPSIASADVVWHYPRHGDATPPVLVRGTSVDDVMSPAMPFTDIILGKPHGATNRDMLMHKPDYVYERMVPELALSYGETWL